MPAACDQHNATRDDRRDHDQENRRHAEQERPEIRHPPSIASHVILQTPLRRGFSCLDTGDTPYCRDIS
ncbi:hypothetical protein ACT3XD_18270 [Halomonas sp. AOP7-B1-5]|uniref:hypothetical protein n=1 Tax=Halomonas sp. AOP7-B1-5 TaxID=3457642 RepID=UPI0040279A97